mgnify:CR=1 FL=1
MDIIDLLVQRKIVHPDDAQAVRSEVKKVGNINDVLRRRGIDPEEILKSKAEYFNVPTKTLGKNKVPFEVLKYIPEESATYYQFVPVGLTDGVLEVGMLNPDNIEARDALNFISTKANLPYKIFLISQEDFDAILQSYKGIGGEVGKALTELGTEDNGSASSLSLNSEEGALGGGAFDGDTHIKEDAPVTKIVTTILHYATEGNASDIHIEAMEDAVRVRFRVDGSLVTSLTLPGKVHSALVARIKILCNMKIDEKRKPQDGRFSQMIDGKKIDYRVSTFPAYYGEKVVMRILDSAKGVRPLDQMGLSERNLKTIREAIERPYGLILISGPTGSGKSTTLYSMLNSLDKETRNVLSLEDPVEYNIPGMSQSQVRPEIGYTFATGLRTTLRQDPDIIMVGEIRDKETAQLAVQAALTGHLVLSTIHTNNAAGVIPRLIDMGVDPFLIGPTLICAIAQRLVRTLCEGGGKEVPVEGHIKDLIDGEFKDLPAEFQKEIPKGKMVYEAMVTDDCPKGTLGRAAVMEVLTIDKDIEKVILNSPTELDLMKVARAKGMLTMKEDAIIKAFERKIPFEEVTSL